MKGFHPSIGLLVIISAIHFRGCNTDEKNDESGKEKSDASATEIKRLEEFGKSPRDKRSYRGLRLPNNLQVLLISDPETDKAAASMAVSVGSIHDPVELPGAAHLLEHMLFMGSGKYPTVNHFSKYLQDHAGDANGHTFEEWQEYHWDIDHGSLSGMLDIWAQFFLHPLIDPSFTEKEINAVDMEHARDLLSEWRKLNQLQKLLIKPNHLNRRFATGNLESLSIRPKAQGINVQERLSELHSTWYSSNIMHLAVLGRENLNDLEQMVVPLFANIADKQKPRLLPTEPPWGDDQLCHKVYYVPAGTVRMLTIHFPTPSVTEHYKTAPLLHITHLLGHEGPGSLLHELSARAWCDALSAGPNPAPGFSSVEVDMFLTLEGMDHVDDIVKMLFQYIYLLKVNGVEEWFFEEIKTQSEIDFEFERKESPGTYVQQLTYSMQDFPFEDILHAYVPKQYNATIMNAFLEYLVPENMNILIGSKTFENVADQIEPWYGTKYKITKISEDLIKKMWNITEPSDRFHLPPPNEFIAENLRMYPSDENAGANVPRIIHQSRTSEFWFKQDDEFELPTSHVKFHLFSPITCADVRKDLMTQIFVDQFAESFTTFAYASRLAGYAWALTKQFCSLEVSVSGFTEKLPRLLEKLLLQMTEFTLTEEKFDIAKESLIRQYMNFETYQPHINANVHSSYLLSSVNNYRPLFESLVAAKTLRMDDMKMFIRKLFSRVFIRGIIYGNCSENRAKNMIEDIIEQPFTTATVILTQEILPARTVEIGPESNFTYEAPHKYAASSCYYGYFQLGSSQSILNGVLADLFIHIVKEKCFQELRTTEQLGYIVWCGERRSQGALGFVVKVQSSKHPNYLKWRVEVFLRKMRTLLERMTEQEFESEKTATKIKYLQKAINQNDRMDRYWQEIGSRRYHFEIREAQAEMLNSVQREDLINFFKEHIDETSGKQKKLNIHVIPEKMQDTEMPDEVQTESKRIGDVDAFRNSFGLFHHTFPHSGVGFTTFTSDAEHFTH